jgi:hypothetical protein
MLTQNTQIRCEDRWPKGTVWRVSDEQWRQIRRESLLGGSRDVEVANTLRTAFARKRDLQPLSVNPRSRSRSHLLDPTSSAGLASVAGGAGSLVESGCTLMPDRMADVATFESNG